MNAGIIRQGTGMRFSVIIPAYIEEVSLGQTIVAAYGCLDYKLPDDFELLVVDDGCDDETGEAVEKLSGSRMV